MDRLVKLIKDVEEVLVTAVDEVNSGAIFEHGYPEARLVPKSFESQCIDAHIEYVVERVSDLISEALLEITADVEMFNNKGSRGLEMYVTPPRRTKQQVKVFSGGYGNEIEKEVNEFLQRGDKVISLTPNVIRDHWNNGEEWFPANEYIEWVLIYEREY